MKQRCEICDELFDVLTMNTKICPTCNAELYTSPRKDKKKHKELHSKLLKDVKDADKHGVSYGKWKGYGL